MAESWGNGAWGVTPWGGYSEAAPSYPEPPEIIPLDPEPFETGVAQYATINIRFTDDRQVGSVTSAGYGHRVERNIAYAYIEPDCAEIGTRLSLGILGERYAAEVVEPVLYDPQNQLPRS